MINTDDDPVDSGDERDERGPDYKVGEKSADDEHQQALERLQLSAEAYDKQNQREVAALRFQVPEFQWTKEARDQRAGETLGDITIPNRPTIAIPKIDQPIQLILNQERAAHLGVSVHPGDERTDDETCDIVTGLYREIERRSRAGLARSWAFERAVKAGRGMWRVMTVPAVDYLKTRDQDIRITRLLYQESAYLDPFGIEPDWSDGEWGHVLEWVSSAKYKRLHAKVKGPQRADGTREDLPSKLAQMGSGELTNLMEIAPDWIRGDGEGRAYLVGDYMYLEDRPTDEREVRRARWRPGEYRRVCWRKMNAVEFMDYGVIHSLYIPLVPAIGRELIPFDQERRWVGVYEPNMDGQRFFNYSASTVIEVMATEPRNTWVIAEGQEKGHERELLLANVRNFPYVRYRPTDLNGNLVPGPRREQADTSRLGIAVQALQMAGDFLHAGTSTFEPSLGNTSPNVRTKGGTLALQAQSEQANSNWLDNLSELSFQHETKIVLSMIPHYYGRPGRIHRILGLEEKDAKTVMLNAPYRMQGDRPQALPYATPQDQQAAAAAVANPDDAAVQYNLAEAIFSAVVSIGKGYKSRVEQGADELGQIFQADPELFKILGDIYLRFRDFPGHEEAAKRIAKLLPPTLQDPDSQQDPRVQLEQAKAAMQQMQQALEESKPEKLKADVQLKIAQMKHELDVAQAQAAIHLQAMKDATQLGVAKIAAMAKGAHVEAEAEDEAIALGREHAFQEATDERDRQHQLALAAVGHAAGQQAAEADQARALEAGDVVHQQGQEAADAQAARDATAAEQGQGHALEQMAAQPVPGPDTGPATGE